MLMILTLALLLDPTPAVTPLEAAVTRPQLVVLVHQETQPPLTAEVLRLLTAEATEIWRPYLDVAFQPAATLEPLRGDDTLNLVLTDAQSNGRFASGLGWIDFVDGEPSRTITVSVGAARELAAQGKWSGRQFAAWPPSLRQAFMTRTLARGVAHEIGHYLLRSKAHTPHGLMRARFTVDEMMLRGLGQYRLQPADVELLERRTSSYALTRRRSAEPDPQ